MKFGLIGASTIASQHMIGAIRAQDHCEIAWVMSSDQARAESYAKAHGIENFGTDLDDLLSDKNTGAVYISTTNEKHFPQAMAAIKAGKHVICEKPIGMDLAEAKTMIEAAKNAGVIFATNHHLRNAGSHLAIKELIASGRIGKVLSMRVHHAVHLPENLQGWRINDASAGGGVIPDITVHDADTVRFYLDEDPTSVVAKSTSSGMGQGVEDSAMSIWTMPSGAMIFTHESFTHAFAGTSIEVHGAMGSIFARDVMTQQPIGEIELVISKGRENIPYSNHNLYVRSVAKFLGAVAGNDTLAADGVDGLKSLAVALAVRAAANSGQLTEVDYAGYGHA